MSARQRREREKEAQKEGRQARMLGVRKDKCPYQMSPWGLGPAWAMGWDYADQELAAAAGQCMHRHQVSDVGRTAMTCVFCGKKFPMKGRS